MSFMVILLRVLVVLFLLGYLLYRLLWKSPDQKKRRSAPSNEEMVKDPLCGTYVSLNLALPGKKDGRKYYFCSRECRDKFLNSRSQDE